MLTGRMNARYLTRNSKHQVSIVTRVLCSPARWRSVNANAAAAMWPLSGENHSKGGATDIKEEE